MELWHVRPSRQVDLDRHRIALPPVIQCEPFSDFRGRCPNDRILVRVISRTATEHLDSQSAFLEVIDVALKSMLYHVSQEAGVVLAVPEVPAREKSFQLFANCNGSSFIGWKRDGLGWSCR